MADYNQNSTDHKVLRDQLITIQDLIDFKKHLIADIKTLLKEQAGGPAHQWLKSVEVKKWLRISESKLQYLRDHNLIPFRKLGNITYYSQEEIDQLLRSGKLSDQLSV